MAAGGGSTDIRGACKTTQCSLAIAGGGGGGGIAANGNMYVGGDAGYPNGAPGGVYTAGTNPILSNLTKHILTHSSTPHPDLL